MKRIPTVVSLSIASPNVFALVKFFLYLFFLRANRINSFWCYKVEFSFDNQNLLITHYLWYDCMTACLETT